MPYTTILASGAGEIIKLIIQGVSKKIANTTDPTKARILRELRENIKVLSYREKVGITRRLLVTELSNTRIQEAIDADYKFKKLRRRSPHTIPQNILPGDNTRYLNRTCEEMLVGIDSKISDLKRLCRMYGDQIETIHTFNITLRLNNLNYQLVILSKFISYQV